MKVYLAVKETLKGRYKRLKYQTISYDKSSFFN
ncbi:hypothetical protein SJAV_16720 [Sulfurisphaera javensis]|uniref:Transposase n=1 Tax=Sulfurisphaera javensis TaxID=2049879 RepID=A0AAT9GS98_9CREN